MQNARKARSIERRLWNRPAYYGRVLRGAIYEWNEDKAPRMAAAIAFYTVFSLTPIVVISIGVADMFFPKKQALDRVLAEARFLIGDAGVEAVNLLYEHAPRHESSLWVTMLGLATTFFAATGAFTELQDALDTIWEVRPKPGLGIWAMVKARFLSFALVLVIGFLLIVSLIASTGLAALSETALWFVTDQVRMLQIGNFIVSMVVITLLFALIYRVLPDAEVAWSDVWVGAVTTAFLFAVGKSLFGLYLGHSSISSSYGAAGSLVIVVLWTYYSALILLFGAEITQVQAKLCGHAIVPTQAAIHLTEHERTQQGITHQQEIAEQVRAADGEPAAKHAPT